MKVSIAKALKIRARLAGEISRLKDNIISNNIGMAIIPVTEDKQVIVKAVADSRPVDVRACLNALTAKTARIAEVKIAIAKANSDAQDLLVRLAEAKSGVEFVNSIRTERAGYTPHGEGYLRAECAEIGPEEKEEMRAAATKLVEDLQDEIDEYNATHFVEIAD